MRQKRIVAIHDISCVGRCSLTVALPVISAAGVEVSVIPTAVLSTHTGGFYGYTYRDLSDDILPIAGHWQSLGLQFDAFYTGFLGSYRQLDIIAELFERFKRTDNLMVVDPVMADHGQLYKVYDSSFPIGMRKLCKKADILVPNITEACLLTDTPYREGPYGEQFIEELLNKLLELGPGWAVLTGVCFEEGHLGVATCSGKAPRYYFRDKIEGIYHGTGDVFASTLLAALMNGVGMETSARVAVDFTVECIGRTKSGATDPRYGVNFEAGLKGLAERIYREKDKAKNR
ncbi:MAG: pyridoxamine kinase [Clostridiales bacterium]|nr:pyridoxamine kinase [Clostridiales bacterium]